jgi:hypothetical protein
MSGYRILQVFPAPIPVFAVYGERGANRFFIEPCPLLSLIEDKGSGSRYVSALTLGGGDFHEVEEASNFLGLVRSKAEAHRRYGKKEGGAR